jgi:hypothetical protein
MLNSVEDKNRRRETMKRGKTFAGTVALAAIIALSWLVVPTAGAGDKKNPQGAESSEGRNSSSDSHGAGDHGMKAVLRLLDDIRVQLDGLLTQGNICTAPDLVPLPVPGGGFCRIDAQGRLHVVVHNQGGAAAGPSQTLVSFRATGAPELFVDTDQLAGFSGTDLAINIPDGCFGNFFSTDDNNVCKFQILVDFKIGSQFGAVAESDELNNAAFGACQGLL